MTDKEKLEKIKALADKMYSHIAYLTSDTRPIRQAMDEYHQFIINEYHKEEPVSEDLEEAVNAYIGYAPEVDESSSTYGKRQAFKAGANWQKQQILDCNTTLQRTFELGKQEMKQQMMAKAVDAVVKVDAGGYPYIPQMELYDYDKDIPLAKECDKYKVILIKEE